MIGFRYLTNPVVALERGARGSSGLPGHFG
jgi:hypothetical protein